MKKNIISALAACCFAFTASFAQSSVPTAEDYSNLDDTRTLVVLDDNILSDFNIKIKKVMEKEWNLTKYDIISRKEFEAKRTNPSYSFLTTTTVTYEKDKTKARYTYLSLLMGKEKTKVNTMPDLISIPLAYASVVDQNYVYKLTAFVRFVEKHVNMIKNDPSILKKYADKPLTYYNKNTKSLAGKTLYLVKEDLEKSLQSEKAVAAIYPYKFKFVTADDVTAAIENSEKDIVFLHKVGPEVAKANTRCFKMIIGADDSEVYYFDYHNIDKKTPDRLLGSDLKKMGKK
ncbi:MAG: hypothetical protein MJZ15_08490 [Bacteroidales bacterium]|nr:hypothetical protein [Bacteroidales bacterium]